MKLKEAKRSQTMITFALVRACAEPTNRRVKRVVNRLHYELRATAKRTKGTTTADRLKTFRAVRGVCIGAN